MEIRSTFWKHSLGSVSSCLGSDTHYLHISFGLQDVSPNCHHSQSDAALKFRGLRQVAARGSRLCLELLACWSVCIFTLGPPAGKDIDIEATLVPDGTRFKAIFLQLS